jgi:hypothetical protein
VAESVRIGVAVGQVWEGRQRRRDGSVERVRIVEVNGRRAVIDSENPRPPLRARREVALLINELTRTASLGNMRLVEIDGRSVSWPPGGGMVVQGYLKNDAARAEPREQLDLLGGAS